MARDDADSEFSTPSLEVVLRRTRHQLLDCARYLGLTGVHRLTKDALARRLLQALQRLAPPAGAEAQEPADRPHKFDLGPPTEKEVEVERIPWGYGQDRVTAMVVDPERVENMWRRWGRPPIRWYRAATWASSPACRR